MIKPIPAEIHYELVHKVLFRVITFGENTLLRNPIANFLTEDDARMFAEAAGVCILKTAGDHYDEGL